jgi:phosphoribosylanthranilate isomerase
MPLKTLVKVGNITNLSDARYCAGMGVEMLGFTVVEGKKGYISAKAYQEIRGWLSGPSIVAEIYSVSAVDLPGIIESYVPDFLELAVEDLSKITPENNIPLILSLTVQTTQNQSELISDFKHKIAYVILTASSLTNYQSVDAFNFPVLVALESDAGILELIEMQTVNGITLMGSQELKPGLKDYGLLADVLEKLDVD